MKHAHLALMLLIVVSSASASPLGDSRPPASTNAYQRVQRENPIRLEGPIRAITHERGSVTIRLHRDRYPIVATRHTRVRWVDGREADLRELRIGDSIRVSGDLDGDVIYAHRVTVLLAPEHRGGNF